MLTLRKLIHDYENQFIIPQHVILLQPYISVIVTAYNRKEFLKDALESLLMQNLPEDQFEVILITNFEYNTEDYKFLRIKHKVMEGSFREYLVNGVELSEGQIICFMDDDDIFMENKLNNVRKIFQTYPEVDYYRHNFKEVDYNLKPIWRNSVKHVKKTIFTTSSLFKNNLIYLTFNEVFFNSSTIAFRKPIFQTGIDKSFSKDGAPDLMLWIIAIINANAIYIDKDEFSLYRIHKNSAIHSDKSKEEHNCIPNEDNSLILNLEVDNQGRKALLDFIVLKSEVLSSLFCEFDFTLRHYIMNFLLILLSANKFKAFLVFLKQLKVLNKPLIVKMIKKEDSMAKLLGRFLALLKLAN